MTQKYIAIFFLIYITAGFSSYCGKTSVNKPPETQTIESFKNSKSDAGANINNHQPFVDKSSTVPPPLSPSPGDSVAFKTSLPATSSPLYTEQVSVIPRAELQSFLKQGPHHFIQQLLVRPYLRKGKFIGWRLINYSGPGPLRKGDIVINVNNHSIERPEQFMEVWNSLEKVNEITVKLLRNGRFLLLRYTIH